MIHPDNPFAITTGSSPNKAFAVGHVINNLIKRFGGDTDKAINYLQQPVTIKELQAFNQEVGYRGPVGDIGAIRHAVEFATGQSELVPRMFVFGKKVGAYTLNNLGDARYNTVDVWESRFVKSYLKGMLEKNPGIAADANEHEVFRTFVEEFNRIWREQINPKEKSSALQAGRWFYMIESARKAGYTRGVTNDVISQYAKEHFEEGQPRFAPSGKFDTGRGRTGDGGGISEAPGGIPASAGLGRPAATGRPPAVGAEVAGGRLPERRFLVDSDSGRSAFETGLQRTNQEHKYGAAVEVKPSAFYQDPNTKLFLSEDGLAGVAVTPKGDLVSVFKHPDSKANMRELLAEALPHAKELDAYTSGNGHLPNLYAQFGFRPVARIPFDPEFAPSNWNYELSDKPDIVSMVRDPANVLNLPDPRANGYSAIQHLVPIERDFPKAQVRQDEAIRRIGKAEARAPADWLDAAAERAATRIREKLGGTNIAADPTILADVAVLGAKYLRDGIRNRAEWGKKLVDEVGDWVKPHLDDLYDKAKELYNRYSVPQAERAYQTRLQKQIATMHEEGQQLATGTYKPPPARTARQLSQQTFLLQAERNQIQNDFDRQVRRDELLNRPLWERSLDTLVKGERALKLLGLTIYPKLAAAAATRIGFRPLEQLTQSGLGQIPGLRTVHRAAPLSGFSPAAELAALSGVGKGIKEAPGRILGRRSPEEELYGKPELEPRTWLDYPATTHAAVKAPVEEAERARATTMLEAHAKGQGLDLNDARVKQDIGTVANQEAKRSIFMSDNVVSSAWKTAMRSMQTSKKFPIAGKVAAAVGNFLLPIVRVPTNIAIEAGMHTPILGQIAPTAKLLQVMHRGLDTIKPEEANMIMRHYAKGAIGAGLFFTGYFMAANGQMGGFYQPGKRDPNAVSPMNIRIGGINIPGWLLHAPAFLVMQAGATFYKASHHTDAQGKPDQSAVLRTAKGLAEEIPFMKEMGTLDALLADEHQGQKARGALLSGSVVPQAVRNVAQWTDPLQEPGYRAPKNELQYLMKDVPGLREKVPVKGEPSAIPPSIGQQIRKMQREQGYRPPKSLKQQLRELQKQEAE
jgi:hypothetical protein